MRITHRASPLAPALAVALAFAGTAGAAEPTPALDASALGLGPIDVATLELSVGAASTLDADRPDIEGRAGFTLLRADLTGVALELVGAEVLARSGRDRVTGTFEIYNVEHWFVGASEDGDSCLALPGMRTCLPDSGFFGFSVHFPSFQIDDAPHRWAARFFELSFLLSPTPGYGPEWRNEHVLLRAGASIDHLWARADVESETLIRPFVGLDAALRAGPLDLAPSFRWRVTAASGFPDDSGVEAFLRISHRDRWHGRPRTTDPFSLAMIVGYAYWSEPRHALGADWSTEARHDLFVRLSLAPTFFSPLPF